MRALKYTTSRFPWAVGYSHRLKSPLCAKRWKIGCLLKQQLWANMSRRILKHRVIPGNKVWNLKIYGSFNTRIDILQVTICNKGNKIAVTFSQTKNNLRFNFQEPTSLCRQEKEGCSVTTDHESFKNLNTAYKNLQYICQSAPVFLSFWNNTFNYTLSCYLTKFLWLLLHNVRY